MTILFLGAVLGVVAPAAAQQAPASPASPRPAAAPSPEPAAEDSGSEFAVFVGPGGGVVVGDFENLSDFAVGFRLGGGFELLPQLEALVAFDWQLAHKSDELSSEDGLVFYGFDIGFRYYARTSSRVSFFGELGAQRVWSRLAEGSDVVTEGGFGIRGGLGALIPITKRIGIEPSAGYSAAFYDNDTSLERIVFAAMARIAL